MSQFHVLDLNIFLTGQFQAKTKHLNSVKVAHMGHFDKLILLFALFTVGQQTLLQLTLI